MLVKYILPGFYEHFNIYKNAFNIFEKYPYFLNENTSIGAIYGNFQFCIWDGGRIFTDYQWASKQDIIKIRDYFNEKNIPLRFIYTNPILKEKDFYDRYSHFCTSLCYSKNNEIVINNSEFELFMRKEYPDFKYISSTTKCLTNMEQSLEEIQKESYYMICLDYNLNKNEKFLKQIPKELYNKIEFLSNAICAPACPSRKKHYMLNGISHLNAGKNFNIDHCGIQQGIMSKKVNDFKNTLTPDDIYKVYAPQGFENFKLEGRTLPDSDIILILAKYLIKTDYQFEFIQMML